MEQKIEMQPMEVEAGALEEGELAVEKIQQSNLSSFEEAFKFTAAVGVPQPNIPITPGTGESLEAAIKLAKKATESARSQKRGRSKGLWRVQNRKQRQFIKFVQRICSHLQEEKVYLMRIAVKILGMKMISDLVKEVDNIESSGGQMTADGKRRRTPGGVLWNILKLKVEPEVYKNIMAQATEVKKERIRGDKMGQQAGSKRARGNENPDGLHGKRRKGSRKMDIEKTVCDATTDGTAPKIDLDADAVGPSTSAGISMPLAGGHARRPVAYDDLLEDSSFTVTPESL